MSHTIFITATDTDAGKTYVTADAVRQLLATGIRARAVKPVACGINDRGGFDDLAALCAAQQLAEEAAISRYRFERPAAPALADDSHILKPNELNRWCRQQAEGQDILLIEGVGGLMVPLAGDWLVSDWIGELQPDEVWLVVRCRLGAINHALLSREKLQRMGHAPAHIILNAIGEQDAGYLPDLQHSLRAVAGHSKIHTLRTGESLNMHEILNFCRRHEEGEPL